MRAGLHRGGLGRCARAADTGSQVRTPAITGARVRVSLAARAGGIPRRRCRMSRGALASAAGFRPPAGGEA